MIQHDTRDLVSIGQPLIKKKIELREARLVSQDTREAYRKQTVSQTTAHAAQTHALGVFQPTETGSGSNWRRGYTLTNTVWLTKDPG